MAKTFTPQVSERTKEAIVLCKMAEELNDRLSEFSTKHQEIDLGMITEACNDMTTVCSDISIFLSECVSLDRTLDNPETE